MKQTEDLDLPEELDRAEELDQVLEDLRLERAPQVAHDQESDELLAMARAVRRMRPADSVDVPPAPPMRTLPRRRPQRLAVGAALATIAAVVLLVLWVQPVDVVQAAEKKLADLTSYHTVAHITGTAVDPETREKRPYEWTTEIWYDSGKYRIQMGEDLTIFDGDTEWQVYAKARRVVKTSGLPEGRIRISTVDDLVRWFKEYPHVVEGEEVFDGRPAYRVAVQLKSDLTQYVWLDKKTFLPLGGRTQQMDGGETAWTERMELNVPIDSTLFTYQPPEGFTVEERARR